MIFTSEKAKVFRKRLKNHAQKSGPFAGVSRRATCLLPAPITTGDILLKGASISGYSSLLLSLEANQQSGCVIVKSEKSRSRSGILIFRGRILGCMYGQKNLDHYLFGEAAYNRALSDLQNINKTVDVYGLKEEIVIAASALFHGPIRQKPELPASQFFEEALTELSASNTPGCIVITDRNDNATYIVYMFAGRIVGIHCSRKGWLQPDVATVRKHLSRNKNLRIQSCFIPCKNVVEVGQFSFSLSGLADRDFVKPASSGHHYVPNIFYLLRMDEARLRGIASPRIHIAKFIPNVSRYEQGFINRLSNMAFRYSYSVRP